MLLLVQMVALKYVIEILTCCRGKHVNFVNMDISTMMQNGT